MVIPISGAIDSVMLGGISNTIKLEMLQLRNNFATNKLYKKTCFVHYKPTYWSAL